MNITVLMQKTRQTFGCWPELFPYTVPSFWQVLFYDQMKLVLSPTSGGSLVAEPFIQQFSPKVKVSLTRLHRTSVSLGCIRVRSSSAVTTRAIASVRYFLTDAEHETGVALHKSYQIC